MPRDASLCWGQRYVWLKHHQLPPGERHELNLINSIRPAAGSTIESIRLALNLLVRRHEGLRTTCHAGGRTGPVQRVHPPRAAPIVCYDARDHSATALTALLNDFTTAEFALDEEWPLRACIVARESVPTRVILVGHHTALDDWSMNRLRQEADELHGSIMARRSAALPPVSHHPVDLARYEESADAARAHRRSREHWDHGLSRIPADLYGTRRPADPAGRPSALSASLSSPAVLAGARELAARYGVWPSIVYTAAFTALLAAYTRSPVVGYRTYASNRDAPRYPDVVTCMFQPVLVAVDCPDDLSLAEVIRRTARQCTQALGNSYCAYDEIMEAVSRHSSERGMGIRVGTVFNYLRHPDKVRGGKRTTFSWNPPPRPWMFLDDDCYLRVSEWRDSVMATLNVRSTVMATDDVGRFLRGFETLLTAAADLSDRVTVSEIGRLAGFSPATAACGNDEWTGGNIVVVDGTTVDVRRVAECLGEYPGVRAARVFADHATTGGGDRRLTAYVASADPTLEAAALRAHVLGRMYDIDRLCCPHRFVICDRAPTDAHHRSGWAQQPTIAAGSGRQVPEVPPDSEPQRLLRETVGAVNQLDRVSMAQSYVMAGGRVMTIPLVQQIMADRGWAGPSLYDIASARPLAAIAAMFAPIAEPADIPGPGHKPARAVPATTAHVATALD